MRGMEGGDIKVVRKQPRMVSNPMILESLCWITTFTMPVNEFNPLNMGWVWEGINYKMFIWSEIDDAFGIFGFANLDSDIHHAG